MKLVTKILKYILVYGLLLVTPATVTAIILVVSAKTNDVMTGSDPVWDSPYMVPAIALGALLNIIVFLWRRWAVINLGRIRRPDVWMVVVMAFVLFLGWFFPEDLIQKIIQVPDNISDEEFEHLAGGIVGLINTAVLAPVAEELLCRGAILGVLLKAIPRRPWVGIFVSAIIFGLVHLNPVQMVFGFLYGLLLGWLAWRTASLLPSIVVHVANNSTAMLMPDTVYNNINAMSRSTETIIVALSLVILFFAFRWFARRYEKVTPEM